MKPIDIPYKMLGGAGGGGKAGGGKARVAVEDPDTLQSFAIATLLDAICEGEIKGPVNGLASIELDGVPMEIDGQPNFSGVEVNWRVGTAAQDHIPGLTSVSATQQIGTEVKFGMPIVAQITNVDADAFSYTINIPAMSEQNTSNGDVKGSEAQVKVEYRPQNSPWIDAGAMTITGKTRSLYQRSARVELVGDGPWTVRFTRLTPDSTSQAVQNQTVVGFVTTIQDLKLRYPNTALCHIKIDARQFGTKIPQRTYDIYGMLIRVPSNYDPETREYAGVWDGSFKIAYSNNPAWCLYDLLTAKRYGLGRYIDPSQIDRTELYAIGKYCDEMVDDGFGGLEPRFTLNVVLQSRAEAYKVIQDICSNFRTMTYWAGGAVIPVIDAPRSGRRQFTPANVENGEFEFASTDINDQHSMVKVMFNDPEQGGKLVPEIVVNKAARRRLGHRPTEIIAFGCTSRGQAHRLGEWYLLTELYDDETVSFAVGLEGASLNPGQVVDLFVPMRAGQTDGVDNRMGGRIRAATRNSVELDGPVRMVNGYQYVLYYTDINGAQRAVNVVNVGGSQMVSSLQFVTQVPAAQIPAVNDVWGVSALNYLQPETFVVKSVVEDKRSHKFVVSGLKYTEAKFGAIDNNTVLDVPPTSVGAGLIADVPTNFAVYDTTYLIAPGVLGSKLIVSWSGNTPDYTLQWRRAGGGWNVVELNSPNYEIPGVTEGDAYDFRVWGLSAGAKMRSLTSLDASYTVLGKSAPPGPCTNLTAEGGYQMYTARWSNPPDIDLDFIQILESSVNDFATAQIVGTSRTTQFNRTGLTGGGRVKRYVWVRAVDTSGNVGPVNSNLGTYAETILLYASDLIGEIERDQLAQDLIDEIIVEVAENLPSGIADEVFDRINGITVDSTIITSDQTQVFAGTESIRSTIIDGDTALQKNIDIVHAQSLGNAATIAQEQIARADADSALASQTTALSTKVDGNQAALLDEIQVQSDRVSSVVSRTETLAATVQTEKGRVDALIQTEASARASDVEALTTRVDGMVSRIGTAEAGIITESEARATADSALSTRVDSVNAALTTLDNGVTTRINSAVQTETTARVNADGALGQRVDSVVASVGTTNAAVQQNATAIAGVDGKVSAAFSVKVGVTSGGVYYGAGMAIGVDNNAGIVQTRIYFLADRFGFLNVNNGAISIPFIIDQGQTFIDQAYIRTATIQSAQIASLDAGKITFGQMSGDRIEAYSMASNLLNVETAWIKRAAIQNLAVDTLRIADQSVVIASSGEGGKEYGQSTGDNVISLAINVPSACTLLVVYEVRIGGNAATPQNNKPAYIGGNFMPNRDIRVEEFHPNEAGNGGSITTGYQTYVTQSGLSGALQFAVAGQRTGGTSQIYARIALFAIMK